MQDTRPAQYAPLDEQAPSYTKITPGTSSQNGLAFDRNGDTETQRSLSGLGQENVQAVDTASDRRKRRKVSIGPESQDGNISTPEPHPSENHILLGASQPSTGNEAPIASPETPRKRRGRPPKSITQIATKAAPQTIEADTTPPNHGSPKAKRTTKKLVAEPCEWDQLPQKQIKSPKRSPRAKKGTNGLPAKADSKSMARKVVMKNGKFSQSLVVRLRYADHKNTGSSIDSILATPSDTEQHQTKSAKPTTKVHASNADKSTHPFFSGKSKQAASECSSNSETIPEYEKVSQGPKPVAWKDIVFQSKRLATPREATSSQKPIWPPRGLQHVGAPTRTTSNVVEEEKKQKSKFRVRQLDDEEVAYVQYQRQLFAAGAELTALNEPQRLYCTTAEALSSASHRLPNVANVHAIDSLRDKALHQRSAFDRCEHPGPLPWSQTYAPSEWSEVLQPRAYELHEWLQGLAVHNVKQGLDQRSKLHPKRKKKPKKHDDELDGFIVDDEDEDDVKKVKNAILIVGPHGCGKTASVYAVAKQLNFEVFEIHPGMRRSQKDIFDRVGDMAQNHMVQRGQDPSRGASAVPEISAPSSQEDHAQVSVASFFGNKFKKPTQTSRPTTPQPAREQKQSVILFEEVDQLFEDDRGFWSAVQSFIENSKRPLIMTCNDLESIPLDELDLSTILYYERPRTDIVVTYLSYLAAAEGHILDAHALHHLYESKGCDLRATTAELDFWCQMTVGSVKGGLDWYPTFASRSSAETTDKRVFSQGTYRIGLDLMPAVDSDLEACLDYLNHCLDISPNEWSEEAALRTLQQTTTSTLQALQLSELLSDVDVLHASSRSVLVTVMHHADLLSPPDATSFVLNQAIRSHLKQGDSEHFSCLAPLALERPIFPPAQGRLAPSLDLPRSALAADVAPYVRSIASFDHRLERQRTEVDVAEGKKSRTTRAARAAADGGDKATTRRERWFPAQLDLKAVLYTGGTWPQWYQPEDVIKEARPEVSEESVVTNQ